MKLVIEIPDESYNELKNQIKILIGRKQVYPNTDDYLQNRVDDGAEADWRDVADSQKLVNKLIREGTDLSGGTLSVR